MRKKTIFIILILFVFCPVNYVSAKNEQIVVEKEGNSTWSTVAKEKSLFWIEMSVNRDKCFYTVINSDTAAIIKNKTELETVYMNNWEYSVDADTNLTFYFENEYEFADATIEVNYGTGILTKFWSLYKFWVILGLLLAILIIIAVIASVKGLKSNKEYKDGFKQFSSNVSPNIESEAALTKEKLEKLRSDADFNAIGSRVRRRKIHRKYKNVFFLSHALNDYDPWVKKVAAAIETWPDCYPWHCERDLKPGDDWLEGIYGGLEVSNWFILFWSIESKDSNWTMEEINEAKTRNINSGLPQITTINLGVEEWPLVLKRHQGKLIHSETELDEWLADLKKEILGD